MNQQEDVIMKKSTNEAGFAREVSIYFIILAILVVALITFAVVKDKTSRPGDMLTGRIEFTGNGSKLIVPVCNIKTIGPLGESRSSKEILIDSFFKRKTDEIKRQFKGIDDKSEKNEMNYFSFETEKSIKQILKNEYNEEPQLKTDAKFVNTLIKGSKLFVFNKNIEMIDINTEKKTIINENGEYWPYSVSPDGKLVAWLEKPEGKPTVMIYDVETRKISNKIILEKHEGGVYGIALSDQRKLLAVAYQKRFEVQPVIVIHNIDTKKKIKIIRI